MDKTPSIDYDIAARLKAMRLEKHWSLDQMADKSGVSRASLSRIEKAEVSPTAQVLNKLCTAHGIPVSRLLHMVEETYPAKLSPDEQLVWQDTAAGFTRQSISPPAPQLAGEVIKCTFTPNADIQYDQPPKPGLEHHLILLEGALTVEQGDSIHRLTPGDTLRYKLYGKSRYKTETGATYLLVLI